jgi:hypothetical protein
VTRSQIAVRAPAALLLLALVVYTADYVVLRVRMRQATPTMPFEMMTRARLLAIQEKGGKTDYQLDEVQPTETLTCVHALFPHYGDQPCWYMKPRLNQPIPIG